MSKDKYGHEHQEKPEWLTVSDDVWFSLASTNQKTIIYDIGDDVAAKAYINVVKMDKAYGKVREKLIDPIGEQYSDNKNKFHYIPECARDMHYMIDEIGPFFWSTLPAYIDELKSQKDDTLKKLLEYGMSSDVSKKDLLNKIIKCSDV